LSLNNARQADRVRELIDRAFRHLFAGELEDALMQLAPALEATAKLRYPSDSPSKRTQKFLKDEQDLIYALSTQFRVRVNGSISYGADGELHRIFYKFIRCAQSHDAQIDFSKIILGGDFGVARFLFEGSGLNVPSNKYLISKATVLGLIFSVVVAKENTRLPKTGLTINFFGTPLALDDYLGGKGKFMELAAEICSL
jgi:hypothetical protein